MGESRGFPCQTLFIEGFDQFEKGAVRILEAKEPGAGFSAGAHLYRLRDHFHAGRLEPGIFLVEVLGEKRDAGDPGMVKVRIWGAFGVRLFPLDQVDPRRARIVAEREQGGAPGRCWGCSSPRHWPCWALRRY
jgi:hypothetical protein